MAKVELRPPLKIGKKLTGGPPLFPRLLREERDGERRVSNLPHLAKSVKS